MSSAQPFQDPAACPPQAAPADAHAARVAAAENAVAPWWTRAAAAGVVLVLATLGLLGVFLVVAGSSGTLSGAFVLSSSGTVTLVALAVAALVLVVATVLILRRRQGGVTLGLLVGVAMTAVLGWVATSIVSFSLPDTTAMLVGLSVAALAAAAATVVLALTRGRLLALGRVRDEVGVRTF